MDDIVSVFVVFFVFKALGGLLRSLFHGDKRNDFRRDRQEPFALSANSIIPQGQKHLVYLFVHKCQCFVERDLCTYFVRQL